MQSISELPNILHALSARFPDHLHQYRPQGKSYVVSIAWHTAAERLDEVYPNWSQKIEKLEVINNHVVVTVSISLHFQEGDVTRTNTGIEDVNTDSWGDAVSNAVAMGLKRAAALFGVGRYLYHKDDPSHNYVPNQPQRSYQAAVAGQAYTVDLTGQAPPTPQQAQGNLLPAMSTQKQQQAIWAISKKLGKSPEHYTSKSLKELTVKEAAVIIERLNNEQRLSQEA